MHGVNPNPQPTLCPITQTYGDRERGTQSHVLAILFAIKSKCFCKIEDPCAMWRMPGPQQFKRTNNVSKGTELNTSSEKSSNHHHFGL